MSFYVYELIDPRTGEAFYVGKGSGRRAWMHEKDARSGRVVNEPKHERIMQIWSAGLSVGVRIVSDGLTEQSALELEKQMIAERRDSLTNISMGSEPRGSAVAREAESLLRNIPPINEWIVGWHPDCIKGFGGVFEAAAFYFRMCSGLSAIAARSL